MTLLTSLINKIKNWTRGNTPSPKTKENMIVQYLKGPMIGQEERIVEETEDKGSPVYITESGKQLNNTQLNKLFRIKSGGPDTSINYAELGDPSLAELESDFNTETSKKSGGILAEKLSQKEREIKGVKQPKFDEPTPKKSENVFLNQLFGNAKKEDKKINVSLSITAPTKDFYNLVMNAIEFSDEEFVEKVFSELDFTEINKSIKEEIKNLYIEKKVTRSTKTVKKKPGGPTT